MKIIVKNQLWEEVRKKYKLSDAHIQMAKELGMNPKKIGKIANHKQQSWKEPLSEFIVACYYDRFKVFSLEKEIRLVLKNQKIN